MTDTEIIKAITELDGKLLRPPGQIVEYERYEPQCHPHGFFQSVRFKDGSVRPCYVDGIPDYLTSRDAIVPVIEEQHLQVKVDVNTLLGCKMDVWPAFLASPRQLCEALLRAVGKWNDE